MQRQEAYSIKSGWYLAERSRYWEAEPLITSDLQFENSSVGAQHPDIAESLNNLAYLYDAQGKYQKRNRCMNEHWQSREQLGAMHPNTAQSLDNLANLYQSQGKYREAEPLYERALAINEQQLGAMHPNTARV